MQMKQKPTQIPPPAKPPIKKRKTTSSSLKTNPKLKPNSNKVASSFIVTYFLYQF